MPFILTTTTKTVSIVRLSQLYKAAVSGLCIAAAAVTNRFYHKRVDQSSNAQFHFDTAPIQPSKMNRPKKNNNTETEYLYLANAICFLRIAPQFTFESNHMIIAWIDWASQSATLDLLRIEAGQWTMKQQQNQQKKLDLTNNKNMAKNAEAA